MSELPRVNSTIQILRVEVWVTNRNVAATTDTRDIVALMDLGENVPIMLPGWWCGSQTFNDANIAISYAAGGSQQPQLSPGTIAPDRSGLAPVQEFEKTLPVNSRLPNIISTPRSVSFSLNQPLQPEEVLGIAFQYTYNGRVYQVGEFSQDVPPDSSGTSQKVLFPEIAEGNFAAYQPADLGPDDEKRILRRLWPA